MAGRPLDWTPLNLDEDPVPGSVEVLRRIAQEFRQMSEEAREVSAGLDAVVRGAESSGFKGATADALRQEISGRLKRFIENVAASFNVAASAMSRYQTAVEASQNVASQALDAAGRAGPDDHAQRDSLRELVRQQREWLVGEARSLEQSLHDAADMVSQPIKVKSKWLKVLEIALLVTVAVVSVVGIFTGGWIALAGWAMSMALMAKTAVDYAHGRGEWWQLALAVLGAAFPSTRGVGFAWMGKAVDAALRSGSAAMRGVETAGLAVGRTLLSPVSVAKLIRSGVAVLPGFLGGSGTLALQAIRGVPGVIGRTASAAHGAIDTASGFAKGLWNAGVTAVHTDFVHATAQAGGMASKVGTYAVVNAERAFDLAVTAVTPLRYNEITSLGYAGAFHLAVIERGSQMMAIGDVVGAGAHAGLTGLDLAQPGAASAVNRAGLHEGLLAPGASLGMPRGLESVPDAAALRAVGQAGDPTSGVASLARLPEARPGALGGAHASAVPEAGASRVPGLGRSAVVESADAGRGTGSNADGVGPGAASSDSAAGRLAALDQSLGLERTDGGLLAPGAAEGMARRDSGLLVPGESGVSARAGGDSLLPGFTESHVRSLLRGNYQALSDADDAVRLHIGDAAGTPAAVGPAASARAAGRSVTESNIEDVVRAVTAEDAFAHGRGSLAPTASGKAGGDALDLLAGGRSGDAAGDGADVGVGRVAGASPVSGRGLDSAGAPSPAAGQGDGVATGGLDAAGQASRSSGFEPVGLHEAVRLGGPGGPERLRALPAEQAVADGLDAAADPARSGAGQAGPDAGARTVDGPGAGQADRLTGPADPRPLATEAPAAHFERPAAHPEEPAASQGPSVGEGLGQPVRSGSDSGQGLAARTERWQQFRTERDAEYHERFTMAEQLRWHTDTLDSDLDTALARFREEDLFGGARLPDDSPALREVRQALHDEAKKVFDTGWQQADGRAMPREAWQAQLDELRTALPDRLARASEAERHAAGWDQHIDEALAQFRQDDLFGGAYLDAGALTEFRTAEHGRVYDTVGTAWDRAAGHPPEWRAVRVQAALDDLRSTVVERLQDAGGLNRFLRHGQREFDEALDAWQDDLAAGGLLGDQATARTRQELTQDLRTIWEQRPPAERDTAFDNLIATLPKRLQHAQFREQQLERAQLALDDAFRGYEDDLAGGGPLSDPAKERLTDEWTKAVDQAIDDHWFTTPGHTDFRPQPPAATDDITDQAESWLADTWLAEGRNYEQQADAIMAALAEHRLGTPIRTEAPHPAAPPHPDSRVPTQTSDHTPPAPGPAADPAPAAADGARPPRPSWDEQFQQLTATLPHRLHHEDALNTVLRQAADDFHDIAGHPESLTHRYDVTDDAFDTLAGDYRKDTVTSYDTIWGPQDRNTDAWLTHEAAHENTFTTNLEQAQETPPPPIGNDTPPTTDPTSPPALQRPGSNAPCPQRTRHPPGHPTVCFSSRSRCRNPRSAAQRGNPPTQRRHSRPTWSGQSSRPTTAGGSWRRPSPSATASDGRPVSSGTSTTPVATTASRCIRAPTAKRRPPSPFAPRRPAARPWSTRRAPPCSNART
jgi:hypothetical protein